MCFRKSGAAFVLFESYKSWSSFYKQTDPAIISWPSFWLFVLFVLLKAGKAAKSGHVNLLMLTLCDTYQLPVRGQSAPEAA
jgi:hypothetical protein